MGYQRLFVAVIILTSVLLAGCIGQSSKDSPDKMSGGDDINVQNSEKPVPSESAGAEVQDGEESLQTSSQETIPLDGTVNISLKENPTTGFMWNVTVTSGLRIENDTYVANPVKAGVAGSGGMHYWLVRGIAKGNQIFDAIYKRSWEPATGNESEYTMNILVK